MEIIKIEAHTRKGHGKGHSKRLRREGLIPAVAYSKGQAAESISVAPKAIETALKSTHGKNAVIELNVEGKKTLTVMLREHTYHPLTRELFHADFVHVTLGEPVDVVVPLTASGKAAGVTAGGTLRMVYRSLPIRCAPEAIPVKIDHDITALGLNEAVKASALKLPAGVKVRLPDDQTVINIVAPEKEREEEAAAATPAAAAAPAAAAKKDDKAAPAKKDEKKKLFFARLERREGPRLAGLFFFVRAMHLVVGLGNPGREYEATRHNIGFVVVDELARRASVVAFTKKFSAEQGRGRLRGGEVVLLKPQTFMNLSGQAVQPAAAFFKVEAPAVVVVHDELDLPFAEVRVKVGGGHAGHNGLRDIIARLGADFVRVRVGVGKAPPSFRGDTADWVLSSFHADEGRQLSDLVARAADVVEDVVALGATAAMNKHNAKKPAPKG